MLRKLSWLLLAALLCVTPWAFAYGPLFPWSIVKPGYAHVQLARADVFYPRGAKLDPAYAQLDRFIGEAEAFHELSMPQRVRVIAAANWSDFPRFSPLTPGRSVGAVTLETGTVIYVSPKIAERGLDFGEFLRHELSHAIVNQNVSIGKQLTLRHCTWLFEGVPVWFGRQRAYVSQSEFLARARITDLEPLFAFDANASHPPPIDIRFAYIAWRDFIDYLAQQRGHRTFNGFFHRVQDQPGQMPRLFEDIYGRALPDMIREFEAAIRSGTYIPSE